MNKNSIHPKYRADIDGLRALAILSVVIYHAFPNLIVGGFVGVDIFFVISGFLITTIILENLINGTFSFTNFYIRRVTRIFPALFLVLLSCYALGWFALYASEFKQLGLHIAASAGFVQNLVLWSESGYFDIDSIFKPLLHLWSLSIEEKFYIFWPLTLWFLIRRKINILKVTLIILCISFAINVLTINSFPTATFYSPLSRFWELLCGAVLAYATVYRKEVTTNFTLKHSNALSSLGMLCILAALFTINKDDAFPSWWALLPTVGSVMLIAANNQAWINRTILSNKLMVWLGLISYPLYLWHWPLISFGQIISAGKLSDLQKLILILTSVCLAHLTYMYWEKLFRNKGKQVAIVFLLLVGLLGYQGWSAYVRDGLDFRQKNILDLYGGRPAHSDENCLKIYEKYQPEFCRLSNPSKSLDTLLIGDSIAHNSYIGLASNYLKDAKNFAMVGWPGRQPLVKTSADENYDLKDSEQMNNLIYGIAKDISIKTVVLTMNQPEINELITTQLTRTVEYLRKNNKQLIFVYPPPKLSFNPIECVGIPTFRPILNNDCVQQVKDINKNYFDERVKLKKLVNDLQIKSFDTYPQICEDQECQIRFNGNLIYRSDGYLSTIGSEQVFKNFNK